MGYYIRVLGTRLEDITLDKLRNAAKPGVIEIDDNTDDSWEAVVLKHEAGQAIAFIQKNPVIDGELGAEELREFIDEAPHYKPQSAVIWLQKFLPTVKVIYSFQVLNGAYENDGWTPLHRVYNAIWNQAKGILQADAEGLSNENGYTILWQFSDTASGPWNMGILETDDKWTHFEMDLGNQQHREAFWRGQVPAGIKASRLF